MALSECNSLFISSAGAMEKKKEKKKSRPEDDHLMTLYCFHSILIFW